MMEETSGEESSQKVRGPKKECETKDDGRYIIFYTFEETGETEPSPDEEDAAP
jgi:hypothetical protein